MLENLLRLSARKMVLRHQIACRQILRRVSTTKSTSSENAPPVSKTQDIPSTSLFEEKKETWGEYLFEDGWRRPLPKEDGGGKVDIPSMSLFEEKKETWGEYLFEDGWRRPLPKEDGGGKIDPNWVWFGFHSDPYQDWRVHHFHFGMAYFIFVSCFTFFLFYHSDWPDLKEWAVREAYIEMMRREQHGLPYISKDYVDADKVAMSLPTDEEIGNFKINI